MKLLILICCMFLCCSFLGTFRCAYAASIVFVSFNYMKPQPSIHSFIHWMSPVGPELGQVKRQVVFVIMHTCVLLWLRVACDTVCVCTCVCVHVCPCVAGRHTCNAMPHCVRVRHVAQSERVTCFIGHVTRSHPCVKIMEAHSRHHSPQCWLAKTLSVCLIAAHIIINAHCHYFYNI